MVDSLHNNQQFKFDINPYSFLPDPQMTLQDMFTFCGYDGVYDSLPNCCQTVTPRLLLAAKIRRAADYSWEKLMVEKRSRKKYWFDEAKDDEELEEMKIWYDNLLDHDDSYDPY